MTSNRWRIADERRKIRFLNEKLRTIGIDVNALNEQVIAKNVSKNAEKAENERLEREILEIDKKSLQYQQNEDSERKRTRKMLMASNVRPKTASHIQRQNNSGFELRFGEYPVSSIQKFDGEDPDWKINQKLKQLALKAELDKQIKEKTENQLSLKCEREKWDNLTYQQSLMTKQLDEKEITMNKNLKKFLQNENRHLATERLKNKENENRKQRRNEEKHVLHEISSELLTELPLQVKSLQGRRKILPDRWKGFNDLERDHIFMELEQQLQAKSLEHQRQMREKREWDKYLSLDTRSWQIGHRQEQRDAKVRLQQLALENQKLAQQQKNKIKNLESENDVSAEYFINRFGCSAR